MSAHFSIDVTELHMFSGCDWWELGAPCTHGCEHRSTKVVGWGPNVSTYELEECSDCGCRAWRDGRWTKERQHGGNSGFWNSLMQWRDHFPEEGVR